MNKTKSLRASDALLKFWEIQISKSQHASNYFFRKTPSHYHMMLIVMTVYCKQQNLTVEELKTKLFKTSRPKSSSMINEAKNKIVIKSNTVYYSDGSSIDILIFEYHSETFSISSSDNIWAIRLICGWLIFPDL